MIVGIAICAVITFIIAQVSLGCFIAPEGAEEFSPRVSTLILYTIFRPGSGCPAALSIVWKSIARQCEQKYRLEAYATLRRRVVAAGSRRERQDVFDRSLDTPESNVA
jgi:hypothetical protein